MRRWLLSKPTIVYQPPLASAGVCCRRLTTDNTLRSPEIRNRGLQPQRDGFRSITKAQSDPVQNDLRKHRTTEQDVARAVRSRHLLRQILRECSYLPDPYAREWMSQHILTRFRTYSFKAWKLRQRDAKLDEDEALYEDRLRAKEKEARSWLTYLKRANEGERKPLMRVLFMAYGRIGRRRWELLAPLLPKPALENNKKSPSEGDRTSASPSLDFEAVSSILDEDNEIQGDIIQTHAEREFRQRARQGKDLFPPIDFGKHMAKSTLTLLPSPNKISPQLLALLRSQVKSSPPDLAQRRLKRIALEMPSMNSWLKPMPRSRIKNKEKEHLLSLLEKVLPPLPTEEWQYLISIASGQKPIPPPISRRTTVKSASDIKAGALETVLAYGKPPTRVLGRSNGHSMTPRFMRRLYTQVLSQCCFMEWNKEKKDWDLVWGEQALAAAEQARRVDNGGEMERRVFDRGVNGFHDWVEWR